MINFNSDKVNGSKNNIKNAKKALEKAKDSLNGITIPDDFKYASNLNNYNETLNKTNLELNSVMNWVSDIGLAFAKARETIVSNNSFTNTISKIAEQAISSAINEINNEKGIKIGSYGLSYNELNSMEYNELNRFLGNKVLGAPIITNLVYPLDKTDAEIPWMNRTKNMYLYEYRIENSYNNNSVCEGAGYWNKNYIVYCDVDTNLEKGYLRVMKKQKIKDSSKKSGWNRTAKETSSIEVEGHSNDIACIPEEGVILHIDDKNNTVNVFTMKKNNITLSNTIKNVEADGIAYDKELKQVVIINGTDAEYFSKNIILDENTKTKPQPQKNHKIPAKVKDKNNSQYYNYIQGVAARDGDLYVSYSGFATDKEKYKGDPVIGNMIAVYDSQKGGECKGTIRDNIYIEIESLDFDEKGDLVAFFNGGSWTRVFKTDLVNAKDIKENY